MNTPMALSRASLSLESIRALFDEIARAYTAAWPLGCILSDNDGRYVAGTAACSQPCLDSCCATRRRAIQEAARWGEPSLVPCHAGYAVWAIPVMMNADTIGGIVAAHADITPAGGGSSLSPAQARRAMAHLRQLGEDANLLNIALLDARRLAAQRESERAEAIHSLKSLGAPDFSQFYQIEEPALIAAIKRGDRPAARGILNRILTGIYFVGLDRPVLLKSLLLELVVGMSRSAVEAGADPTEVLGVNYALFTDAAHAESEEQLCAWLVAALERVMDAIAVHDAYPLGVLLHAAYQYMREHLHEDLDRARVAQHACLSPAHFGRMLKQASGYSFTDLLTKMRIDKAASLLAFTQKDVAQICMECGYNDQSYFTKIFKRVTGMTPGEYRRKQKA